jgi:hypothetical protein
MRYSIVAPLPSSHRLTPSRNRMPWDASTGPRSTPSPAPTCTPRSGSSTPNSRLLTAAGRRGLVTIEQAAVDLAVLEMAANGTALDAGQALR